MRASEIHMQCWGTVCHAPHVAGSECLVTRRHLMIPLVCAERCWAQAMELKTQQEEQPNPQKRQHQIRRLAKVGRLRVPGATSAVFPQPTAELVACPGGALGKPACRPGGRPLRGAQRTGGGRVRGVAAGLPPAGEGRLARSSGEACSSTVRPPDSCPASSLAGRRMV